eukprot:3173515-Amphidinium_carterae.2
MPRSCRLQDNVTEHEGESSGNTQNSVTPGYYTTRDSQHKNCNKGICPQGWMRSAAQRHLILLQTEFGILCSAHQTVIPEASPSFHCARTLRRSHVEADLADSMQTSLNFSNVFPHATLLQ